MAMRKDYREILALTIVSAMLGVALPSMALFVFGGAENQTNMVKFFYYGILMFSAVLVISFIRLLKSNGYFEDNEDERAFGLMTVHSPENTWLYQQLSRLEPVGSSIAETIRRPSRLIFISWIFSLVIGLFISVRGTFVSGTPDLVEGQITETAQQVLAVEPAVISETLFFFVMLFYTQVGAIAYVLSQRFDVQYFWSVVVAKTVVVPVVALEFLGYHLFRYGTQQADQVGVFMLGLTSSFTVAVTDSMIPAYMIHASGNFFKQLSELGLFTNEAVVIGTGIIAVVLSALYLWVLTPFGFFGGDSGGE